VIQEQPIAARRVFSTGWILLALSAFLLVAHGCHGSDADHEPVFVPLRMNE